MARSPVSDANKGRRARAPPDLGVELAVYRMRLHRYFTSRAPPEDADDLVQDVFLRLQRAGTSEAIVDVERYVFAIAHNVLVSQRRSWAVRRQALHQPLDEASEPATELSPERILAGRQDYARFVRAVGQLPPRAQAAFRLHHFDELSRAAIATRLGVTKDAVKALLRRARLGVGQTLWPDR